MAVSSHLWKISTSQANDFMVQEDSEIRSCHEGLRRKGGLAAKDMAKDMLRACHQDIPGPFYKMHGDSTGDFAHLCAVFVLVLFSSSLLSSIYCFYCYSCFIHSFIIHYYYHCCHWYHCH